MVYLQPRAVNTACRTDLNSSTHIPTIEACQRDANTSYCWPPNGTRICVPNRSVPFYWPSKYYREDSKFYLNFSSRDGSGPHDNTGNIYKLFHFTYADFLHGERYEDERFANSIDISIIEHRRQSNGTTQIVHPGPTLILEYKPPSITIASASRAISAAGRKADKQNGIIIGSIFGALAGIILLLGLMAWCYTIGCCACCLFQGQREIARVKRLKELRIQAERAARQPEIDAIRSSVARGEIWNGHVHSGGMWASDMPRHPSRAASRASRASDEIRPVGIVEEQERRLEEQRVEQRRLETRAVETQPPAYEVPPPRYTP